MNINEAYEKTLQVLEEIKQKGIEFEITPNKLHESILKKYDNREDRLPSNKWNNVCFHCKTKEESEFLHQKQMELCHLGICFDSGGGCGGRDWELDWSFHVEETTDGSKENAINIVENLIDKLIDDTGEGIPIEELIPKENTIVVEGLTDINHGNLCSDN